MRAGICHDLVSTVIRRLSSQPAFRIFGKANYEPQWHTIDVFATHRRDAVSGWPVWRGHCITLTANVIAVGWDFATELVTEEATQPSTCQKPMAVFGGRLKDLDRRQLAGAEPWYSASELMAHECGHTAQARRLGWFYWPLGATFTLFREGPKWWNQFENQASENGQFGGIIPGTLHPRLVK